MEMGMDNVDEQADDIYNGILGEIGLEYSLNDSVFIYSLYNLSGKSRNESSKGKTARRD